VLGKDWGQWGNLCQRLCLYGRSSTPILAILCLPCVCHRTSGVGGGNLNRAVIAPPDAAVSGLVTSETSDVLELLVPSGVHQSLKKSDIGARRIEDQSPMPDDLIVDPTELRDLLAFLLGQKK
jgi:hypothetical protein